MTRKSGTLAGLIMLIMVNLPWVARASDTQALLAPVALLMKAINQGATACPSGVFAEDVVIIDDFPPYHWSGRGAGCDWYMALIGTDAKSHADFLAMNAKLSLGAPNFDRVSGDTAYFVLPGVFLFDTDGKTRIRQTANWVVSERRTTGGWRIAGHAWAIMTEVPVH